MDVSAEAIAYKAPASYGLIGLDFIKLAGNASASYYSNGKPGTAYGSAAGNGPIQLGGSSSIAGDARSGVGYSVDNPSKVSGSSKPLETPLSFPNGNPSPYGPYNNDNAYVASWAVSGNLLVLNGNKLLTVPGGSYYVQNVDVSSNSTVTFTGAATVYVYGYININGTVQTAASVPENLRIVSVPDPWGSPPGGDHDQQFGGISRLDLRAPERDHDERERRDLRLGARQERGHDRHLGHLLRPQSRP